MFIINYICKVDRERIVDDLNIILAPHTMQKLCKQICIIRELHRFNIEVTGNFRKFVSRG